MESRWRQNVPLLGLAGGEVTLCARMLNVPWEGYLAAPLAGPGTAAVYQDLGGSQGYDAYLAVVPRGPHFPYGWDVEPDQM